MQTLKRLQFTDPACLQNERQRPWLTCQSHSFLPLSAGRCSVDNMTIHDARCYCPPTKPIATVRICLLSLCLHQRCDLEDKFLLICNLVKRNLICTPASMGMFFKPISSCENDPPVYFLPEPPQGGNAHSPIHVCLFH